MSRFRFDPGSTRLAFFLIAALVLLVLLSAVIPQKDVAEDQILDWQEALGKWYVAVDRLALDRIYFSPPFHVVLGLLAINLLFGNVRRFRTVLRVERTLLRARHVGSIVFHLSLLVIIAGVVFNYLTKFQGIFGMTEGQTVQDAPLRYHHLFEGPLYGGRYGRFEISLEKVYEIGEIEPGSPEAARIGLRGGSATATLTETISVNRPLRYEGLEFHFGPRIGYSPELVVTDSQERNVFRGFVRLRSRPLGERERHEDFVFLPGDSVRVHLAIRPDEAGDSEPVRHVSVEGPSGVLGELAMAPGDTLSAGGYRVTVPRLRRWCYVDIVKNPFLSLVFAGFWAALGGLLISAIARVSRPEGRAS